MAALPDELVADILGRLPLRSLDVSLCVCKAWRAIIADEHRHRLLLPRSVRGLFVNYGGHRRPHFFAHPAAAADDDDGPRIDGKFHFVDPEKRRRHGWYQVLDHCNGLVLYRGSDADVVYVCNPTTRRWARLPPAPPPPRPGDPWRRRAFLVFDPVAASPPHYKVLLAPLEPAEGGGACGSGLMEWPPSPWTWHEFSSATGRWEKKVFVREGEAAGTVEGLLFDSSAYSSFVEPQPQWRAACCHGELYVHCRGEYVSRLSLLNDKYQVIKSPIDLAECRNKVRSFLGRSEKGIYFAAIDGDTDKLRVWVLSDQMGWVFKNEINLKTSSWELQEEKYARVKYDGPWILDIHNKKNKKVSLQQNVCCWNSDDDDIIHVSDDGEEESYYDGYVSFLGFHLYKEVMFLCARGTAVACHFSSAKVQYLGQIHLGGLYNSGERESFVYTPCLIGDTSLA